MNNDRVEQIFSEEVEELCKQLREKLKGYRSKPGSGVISIIINPFGGEDEWDVGRDNIHRTEVSVMIGGYDFEEMSRHQHIGLFNNMDRAFTELKRFVQNAVVIKED